MNIPDNTNPTEEPSAPIQDDFLPLLKIDMNAKSEYVNEQQPEPMTEQQIAYFKECQMQEYRALRRADRQRKRAEQEKLWEAPRTLSEPSPELLDNLYEIMKQGKGAV